MIKPKHKIPFKAGAICGIKYTSVSKIPTSTILKHIFQCLIIIVLILLVCFVDIARYLFLFNNYKTIVPTSTNAANKKLIAIALV